jgi:molybdopterin-biosynthesis enzyme MoeA-like protein
MTRTREKLCALPVGGQPVANEFGIPPGVIVRLPGGPVVACLPGTPKECESVWRALAAEIKELNAPIHRAQRELEAPTADESVLQPILTRVRDEYPTVWIKTFAPGWKRGRRTRGARVVFEGTANTRHEAEVAVEGAMQRLLALAGAGK